MVRWCADGVLRLVRTGMGQFAAEVWEAEEAPMTVEQSVEGSRDVVCSLSVEEEVCGLTGYCFLN